LISLELVQTAQFTLSLGMALPGLRDGLDWDEVLTLSEVWTCRRTRNRLARVSVALSSKRPFRYVRSVVSAERTLERVLRIYYMIVIITCFCPLCKTSFTIPHQLKQTSLFRADGRNPSSTKLPIFAGSISSSSSELKQLPVDPKHAWRDTNSQLINPTFKPVHMVAY
jgi:hypothetical protein